MLTDLEKTSLFKLFEDKGFKGLFGNKYTFGQGYKTSSVKKFLELLGIPETLDNYPDLSSFHFNFLKNKFDTQGFNEVVKEFSESLNRLQIEYTGILACEETKQRMLDYLTSLLPVVNVSGKTNSVLLLNPENQRVVEDVDPEVCLALRGQTLKGLLADDTVPKVVTVFDPYNPKALYDAPSKSNPDIVVTHLNYYVPPLWRRVEAAPHYGGFIKRLLEHLFPVEEEREYVLDWLHYAVVRRNDTVLCLIGPRGTGKGILLKDIMGALIGEKYREIVNQEILTDKFNSAFKNRRYIFFDEVNVSGDRELNRFKALCNTHIALEEKGKDSETINNYTSLALSSNDKKDFKAEPQERRFSVPHITDIPLLKVIPEKEIEEFIDRISTPESVEIAEFGQFLLNRVPVNSSRTPLKTRYFFELCKLSMPEWKIFIIDHLINEGEVGVKIKNSHLTRLFRKVHGDDLPFATRRSSVETFVMDYFHEGVCRIGKVVDAWDAQRSRSTFAIIPSEEFLRRFGNNYKKEEEVSPMSGLDAL